MWGMCVCVCVGGVLVDRELCTQMQRVLGVRAVSARER